jgi:hypothetical protein
MAGRITRRQDAVIEYLREENRVLKQQLGRRRPRLTDDQRRRLAVRGKAIGRRVLAEVASLLGERSLRRVVSEYAAHYHDKRNLQGLGNRLIDPEECVGSHRGTFSSLDRLGGMLRHYRRQVA